MATMNGSARPAQDVTGVLDSVLGDIEGGRAAPRPNPEVWLARNGAGTRASYKQKVLAEADAARGSGEIGAVLRRAWPVFFASDEVAAGTQVRNPGRSGSAEARAEVEGQSADRGNQKLQRENERLTDRLRKAEIVIDVQKKVAMLLGIPIAETEAS
jgi:transposase